MSKDFVQKMALKSNELFQQIVLKICPSFVVFWSGTFSSSSVQKECRLRTSSINISDLKLATCKAQYCLLLEEIFTHGLTMRISPLNLKSKNAPRLQFCACSLHQLSIWEKLKSQVLFIYGHSKVLSDFHTDLTAGSRKKQGSKLALLIPFHIFWPPRQ